MKDEQSRKGNDMNALIVKEDGLIYVNEVPDHPCEQLPDHDCPICQGARDTAVLCAEQGHANVVLHILTDRSVYKTLGSIVVGFHPGIYPIEGLTFSTYEKEFGTGMKSFANLSLEEK